MDKDVKDKLEENMVFVGTIYDSFETLEETLGKLKLERPLFLTYLAKMAFAEEVFKRAETEIPLHSIPIAYTKQQPQKEAYN